MMSSVKYTCWSLTGLTTMLVGCRSKVSAGPWYTVAVAVNPVPPIICTWRGAAPAANRYREELAAMNMLPWLSKAKSLADTPARTMCAASRKLPPSTFHTLPALLPPVSTK